MTAIFADTFYFIALLNDSDEAHARVVEFSTSLRRPLVTTAWVLTELGDGLADRPLRSIFAVYVERLKLDKRATIVPATEEDFDRAIELYNQRPDKEWSLTDCISFIVMQDRNLTEALTGDHHFEQAGFIALLK